MTEHNGVPPSRFRRFRQLVDRARRVLLTGPPDADGDSIGSCLALAALLQRIGVPEVHVAGTPPERYAGLPGADSMRPESDLAAVSEPYDLAVVLDGDRRRLEEPVASHFEAATHQVIIDHHYSSRSEGYHLAMLDADAASTCEVIFALLRSWNMELDRDVATLLYVGTIFDTGGFRHSNTTPATHAMARDLLEQGIDHAGLNARILFERTPRGLHLMGRVLAGSRFHGQGSVLLAAIPRALSRELGTSPQDVEGIVDVLVYTRGVELAVLLVEREPGVVKLSLRSRGGVNVAALARDLHPSGGGHERAAGVVLERPVDELLATLPRRLVRAVARAG